VRGPLHALGEAFPVDRRRRIAATRWPEKETVADQSQGVQLATMQELVRYWGTDYDFHRFEARLNALPQFITEIDDAFDVVVPSMPGYGFSGKPATTGCSST
jgi:Epoxide hydrolase N terminus